MLIYKVADKDYCSILELDASPLSYYESDKTVMMQWEEARARIRNLPNYQGMNAILPFHHDPSVYKHKDGYVFIFTNVDGTPLYLASTQPLHNYGTPIK
ncbi:hypothetical protein F3J29_22080 [Enterobacter sp. Cy-643]|uniref:hypothetical protein n=1 Tax=Enterobacter sp. Cy-643 TaxID=2608346 RepID=UPI00141EE52C|nr:hypothetical protein [Enterobacter sp. Cy-643]NIF34802.1 hypothetical protein [Enterobacter sp. Cy-643]